MKPTADERIRALGALADAEVHVQAFDDAISDYRTYLAARPDDVPGLTNLAVALTGSGRLKEAVPVFQRAAELAPTDGGVQLNFANALFDAGDFPGAAARAERAAALRREDPNPRILRGRALGVQGQLAAAVVEFEAALRIDPQSAEAQTNLARARAAMVNQARR
jgi:Flp pilus assembly protein TadD